MELALCHSSFLRISAVTSSRHRCLHQRKTPIKRNCISSDYVPKSSNKLPSVVVGFKHASKRHQRPNFIRASSRIGAAGSDPLLNKVSAFRDACWRFLRPHTIRGTALGSFALVARALIENSDLIKWSLLLKASSGLLALICGNGYIVGINQIYDIGIDKVNKPYLPIAAGDLSVQSAWMLVIFFAVTGLLIVGFNFGQFITSLYCLGLFLGTIYSVPPFRMKRFAVAAFLIIATVCVIFIFLFKF